MPAFSSSDESTSEHQTGDGRGFATCNARYHDTEPYVWETTPVLAG